MLYESCRLYERYASTPSETAQKLYYYPKWAGHFVCNNDFYIKREGQRDILLIYTLNGAGKLRYRGLEYILTENSAALIDCMDLHIYFPKKNSGWDFYFIHFAGEKSEEFCEHIYSLNGGAPVIYSVKIREYVEECINACKNKNSEFEALVSKKISDMLYLMILYLRKAKKDRLEAVCEFISENCKDDLTTEKIAKEFNFSRCYFSTLFKKHTGTSIHDYLICCRLDKAKELMTEKSLSVEEIAERVGFKDTGTFIRAFKRKEKITPLQYIKKI